MDFEAYPKHPGWKVGNEAPNIRDPLPDSPEDEMICLYGSAPGDWEHRLYLVPANTRIDEIVEFFEVGTHDAIARHWEERDCMDLVIGTLTEVHGIVPGSIQLADSGALLFRFWRRLRLDELEEIEAAYGKVDEFKAGLEGYLNGASGDSILAEVRETGALRLWWP